MTLYIGSGKCPIIYSNATKHNGYEGGYLKHFTFYQSLNICFMRKGCLLYEEKFSAL